MINNDLLRAEAELSLRTEEALLNDLLRAEAELSLRIEEAAEHSGDDFSVAIVRVEEAFRMVARSYPRYRYLI